MKSILHKIGILIIALAGEAIKLRYRLFPWHHKNGLNPSPRKEGLLVVSLTSYGRRVSSVLPFTIISLLRQTCKPDMLVLWLDRDHWDDANLPPQLQRLTHYGLTIRYCEDIKSYTKLIPSLLEWPQAAIVTCDDDIFYKKDMVERLWKAYLSDPTRIYSHRAHQVTFRADGMLKPYNDWDLEIQSGFGPSVFPTGVSGCLYKRELLHADVVRKELFMRLAPKADDVWFYFMERLQGTECEVLPTKGRIDIPLDAFYQYFHQGASLSSTNCKENQNDVQIQAVMEYYGLRAEDLR